jgi:hypothetical protein
LKFHARRFLAAMVIFPSVKGLRERSPTANLIFDDLFQNAA